MENICFLATRSSDCGDRDVDPDEILCACNCMIPLMWYSLFKDGKSTVHFYEDEYVIVTKTVDAKDRTLERSAFMLNYFSSIDNSHPLLKELQDTLLSWEECIANIKAPFVQMDCSELSWLYDDKEEFEDFLKPLFRFDEITMEYFQSDLNELFRDPSHRLSDILLGQSWFNPVPW